MEKVRVMMEIWSRRRQKSRPSWDFVEEGGPCLRKPGARCDWLMLVHLPNG